MSGKIIQLEMFPKQPRSSEEIMLGMIKGLFARDAQRDRDIKKLLEMLMDSNQRIDETRQEIKNIIEYESN